jgi:hypothetical protein
MEFKFGDQRLSDLVYTAPVRIRIFSLQIIPEKATLLYSQDFDELIRAKYRRYQTPTRQRQNTIVALLELDKPLTFVEVNLLSSA